MYILEKGGAFPSPFPQGAVLPVDKPLGWTSFDVVNKLRYQLCRRLGVKKLKIGHAGTLDPLASGLLIICIGEYTKKIEAFQAEQKTYTGVFTFGAVTASYDREKPVEPIARPSNLTDRALADFLPRFRGEILQVPPAFSAVKVDGKRVYKNARTGETVELPHRTVQIYSFETGPLRDVPPTLSQAVPLSQKNPIIWQHPEYTEGLQCDFTVECGKGTYIRSLADDLGRAAGTGAYLSSLRRTRSGGFSVDQAWTIEEFGRWVGAEERNG